MSLAVHWNSVFFNWFICLREQIESGSLIIYNHLLFGLQILLANLITYLPNWELFLRTNPLDKDALPEGFPEPTPRYLVPPRSRVLRTRILIVAALQWEMPLKVIKYIWLYTSWCVC